MFRFLTILLALVVGVTIVTPCMAQEADFDVWDCFPDHMLFISTILLRRPWQSIPRMFV